MTAVSILEHFGIDARTPNEAANGTATLNDASIGAFLSMCRVSVEDYENPREIARYAARVIANGAASLDQIRNNIRDAKWADQYENRVVATVTAEAVGGETVEQGIGTLVATAVKVAPVKREPVLDADGNVIKGKRGRQKSEMTAFDRAVLVLDGMPDADKSARIAALVASGVGGSSAAVYVWRYGKGERMHGARLDS